MVGIYYICRDICIFTVEEVLQKLSVKCNVEKAYAAQIRYYGNKLIYINRIKELKNEFTTSNMKKTWEMY